MGFVKLSLESATIIRETLGLNDVISIDDVADRLYEEHALNSSRDNPRLDSLFFAIWLLYHSFKNRRSKTRCKVFRA